MDQRLHHRRRPSVVPTPREQAYIAAVSAFYAGKDSVKFNERLKAWASAQNAVYESNPDDIDAVALFALSRLSVADKSDKSLKSQREAGALIEKLHTENPEHPAGFHYFIHAYDSPELASKAVFAAENYDKLAPSVPHALHMPSHIFTRMGMWNQSISWNENSAKSAIAHSPPDVTLSHYSHAVDYLVYAYLQKDDMTNARKWLNEMNAINNHQDGFGSAYALAASRARISLEQEDWTEAMQTPVDEHGEITWDKYPAISAMSHSAKGMGGARGGNADVANAAINALGNIHQQLVSADQSYWATLVSSQQKSVEAWLAFGEGDRDKGLTIAMQAADLEDSVDKSPVTPGAVLPARELLGDMLSLMDRHELALAAYESALYISPNRARSLRGAQQAATRIGQTERAKEFQDQLEILLQPIPEKG